ncbi:MAG: NAD-dependent epimerase/dehydratase family protein [Planctomycetaceae bacterium]
MAGKPCLLVTGGAGFLGSHLTRSLLLDERYSECDVIVLDDLSGGFRQNVPTSSRLRFVEGSVTDHELVDQLFRQNHVDVVFHLAAYAAEGLSHFIRRFNYHNNLIGSVNLINAAVRHNIRYFVFTSSIAVYGAGQVPMRESTAPLPEDPYGISKYAVELDLKAAHELFGLNYTVFRPHNVYGEHQNIGDKYRNVVGIFMNRIMQGQALPVFGDGLQQRAFSYVADLMPPMLSAPCEARANGQVFNIGATTPTTVLELAKVVCAEFGVDADIEFLPARNEVKAAWADHSRCDEVFGHSTATPLNEGIRKMAQWARTVGARTSSEFHNIEVTKGLPAGWTSSADQGS